MGPKYVFIFFLSVLTVLISRTADIPLLGSHKWRQADTNFISYSFCLETANILEPKVAMRGDTDGVVIGEFPLYNWITGMTCRMWGGWSEILPKLVSFGFMLAAGVVWALSLTPAYSLWFWSWLILFSFSSLSFVFLNHALPEGLALFAIGCSALLWKKGRNNFLGSVFFVLGFLVRPYLVGLIFISGKTRKQYVFVLPLLLISYFAWYKYWVTEHPTAYFLIHPKPFWEALNELPRSLLLLTIHTAKLHLNWVALPLFLIASWKQKKIFGLWLLSALVVFMVSGYHYDLHPYYLFATMLIGLILVLKGLQDWQPSPKVLTGFLVVFSLVSFTGRAHEFFAPHDNDWQEIPRLITLSGVTPGQRITTADGENPIWLYYAKRSGYAFKPSDLPACAGSSVALIYREAQIVRLRQCE